LEDARQLGISKVDVRPGGLVAEGDDYAREGEQALVDLAALFLAVTGGAGVADGLGSGL